MSVQLFDWPDTFFVDAKSLDDWSRQYGTAEGPAPHLVDLSVPECDCKDFQLNCNGTRKLCLHIIQAQKFKLSFNEKPKPLPPIK